MIITNGHCSVLVVDRRSRTNKQKMTIGRSP